MLIHRNVVESIHTREDLESALKGQRPLPLILQRRMRIVRAGRRRFKTPCPFHNERKPSFYAGGWDFCCYGCGASGNFVDFVARHDEITIDDAVIWITHELSF